MGLKGSKIIGGTIAAMASGIVWPLGRREATKSLAYACEKLAPVYRLKTENGALLFSCPTRAAARMPLSFFGSEPETTAWIRNYVKPGECFWDVGANIGHFSLYAARVSGANVIAFEPSAQTFGVLYKNIVMNDLGKAVRAYCIALSDETSLGEFFLNNASAGEAMHSFGAPENLHGAFNAQFVQAAIGFRGDDFASWFGARAPDHIKLDVDGNEDYVLAGLNNLLQSVKTIMVELIEEHTDSKKRAHIFDLLHKQGFTRDAEGSSKGDLNHLFRRDIR